MTAHEMFYVAGIIFTLATVGMSMLNAALSGASSFRDVEAPAFFLLLVASVLWPVTWAACLVYAQGKIWFGKEKS